MDHIVAFTISIEVEAKFPIPVSDDILTVNDDVGSIVVWPKSLVLIDVKIIVSFFEPLPSNYSWYCVTVICFNDEA